jgi:hypothetical protein
MSYPQKRAGQYLLPYIVYRKGHPDSGRKVHAVNAPKARMEYIRLEREAGRETLYTQVTVQRSRA